MKTENKISLTFYLELEDVTTSKPVLRCFGKKFMEVRDHSDVVLLAEMREEILIHSPTDKNPVKTKIIGITAGHGRSVGKMESFPFSVAVVLPKIENPQCADDFLHLSRGVVYNSLPIACLEMLGYL